MEGVKLAGKQEGAQDAQGTQGVQSADEQVWWFGLKPQTFECRL
jgi:hypothetical protein